jgi:Holliday junction resolvasome RuvABC endonuclease subunit
MIVLCIDPGTKTAGWALFFSQDNSTRLIKSGIFKSCKEGTWIDHIDEIIAAALSEFLGHNVNKVIIEQPQVFMSGKGQAASNSEAVLKLMGFVFAIRSLFIHIFKLQSSAITLVPVTTWKGQIPKNISADRIKRYWNVEPKDNNEADAIGIGDWYFRKHLSYHIIS